MIDSHCHLDHEPLLSNLDSVIERSKSVGITKILTICTTLNSFNKIKGGSFVNMTPDFCELDIDIRTLPNQKYKNIISINKSGAGELPCNGGRGIRISKPI